MSLRLTVHPADDHGLSAGDEEQRDPTGTVRVHQMEEDDASLDREKERESLTFGEGVLKRFSSIISIFMSTSLTRGSPRRKQTTAMARTSSSLAHGLRSCRGNRSVMDVARLSTHTNWRETGPTELLVVTDKRRGDRENKTARR